MVSGSFFFSSSTGIMSEEAVTHPSLSWYSSTSESILADLIFNLSRGPRILFFLGLFSAAFFLGNGFLILFGTVFGFAFGGEDGLVIGFAFGGEGGGGGGGAFGGEGGGGGGGVELSAILTSRGKAYYL